MRKPIVLHPINWTVDDAFTSLVERVRTEHSWRDGFETTYDVAIIGSGPAGYSRSDSRGAIPD